MIKNELIVSDIDRKEVGYIQTEKKFDLDIGDTNDFELTLSLDDLGKSEYGQEFYVYADQTEYGGLAKNIDIDTSDNTITFGGKTWRGMLKGKVIEPPTGFAYKTVTGEVNQAMASVLGDQLGLLFTVSTENSGLTVNYQFDRYTDMLTGFEKMLKTVNARLDIKFDRKNQNVVLKAVPVVDYSDQVEYEDNSTFRITQKNNGANHLIALGKGELTAREVIHLYIQADGTIGNTKFYTGVDEIVETYDYPNAEDTTSLTNGAIDRFEEIRNSESFWLNVSEIPAEIGDIVGGRERISGIVVKKPIVGKIFRIEGTTEKTELKVEG